MPYCPNCGTLYPDGTSCPNCEPQPGMAPPPGRMPPPGIMAPPPAGKTSTLAIVALVLSILGLCSGGLTGVIGLILGIVAISQINSSGGLQTGKGLAIGAVVVGAFTLLVGFLGIFAALAIPNFLKMQAKAKQSEAKTNLGMFFTCEVAYYGENNSYGATFEDLACRPEGVKHYAYFLPGETIPADVGGPYELPPGLTPRADDNGFLVVAVGNVDNDPTLDVWTIDENKFLRNETNDVTTY